MERAWKLFYKQFECLITCHMLVGMLIYIGVTLGRTCFIIISVPKFTNYVYVDVSFLSQKTGLTYKLRILHSQSKQLKL